jgi:hypothetical protein
MSDFSFSFNYDYLNQNIFYNYPIEIDNKNVTLQNEYHKVQSILLTNLRKELDNNDKIKEHDLSTISQKHENNKKIIYEKYNNLLKNLFTKLVDKVKFINS